MYAGYQDDICRTTFFPPAMDYAAGRQVPECRFGGPHPGGWNASFCDGSVRTLAYEIDPRVHRLLGSRADNEPLDTGALGL